MTRKYSSLAGRWPWKSESAKVCVNNSPAEKRKKKGKENIIIFGKEEK